MEHQLKQQKQNSKIAFVLGNGTSRSNLKLENLRNFATVYACNAIYREYDPDYLIAVDVKMVNEIVTAGYNKQHQVWTNPNKGVSTKSDLNFFSPHKGWSSGPTALWFASQHDYTDIYIFGFDFQGVNGKFNNMYADTFNYKKSTDNATYFGNWLNQSLTVIKDNRIINYYRVIESENFIPDKLIGLPNLQHIAYKDFAEKFPKCI
jgi:hypothetical protein